jgi:pyruvate dehydrogenase E1 component
LAGRTTLAGEGLQHCDGHSHLLAATIPCCYTYDPIFAYEIAIIMQDGFKRMFENQEDIYYYITVMNENYAHPAMPEGVEEGIVKGLYPFKKAAAATVQLIGAGAILREVIKAADMLQKDFNIEASVWSATSLNELRRDGLATQHWNTLHPTDTLKQSYVEQCLSQEAGPVIVATDYMKLYADQIRPFLPNKTIITLGTDGYGVSDTRAELRDRFQVDCRYIVLAALQALANEGKLPLATVQQAISKYGINPEKVDPLSL